MEKKRFWIGAFGIEPTLFTEQGVRALAEFGADRLVSVTPDETLCRLCETFGLEVIASGRFAGWWGGDGDNAGTYAASRAGCVADGMAALLDSPCIVGDYLVDEPNARDFAAINEVMAEYRKALPGRIPFVNLYPNYASVAQNTGEETVNQLGNPSYAEHAAQYLREIDCGYFCFDFYPFQSRDVFRRYLENLELAAAACRTSGRELWVIIQTGAWKPDQQITEAQLRWQAYLCLAYGARAVIHACYCRAWWDETTCCVNGRGEPNPMYGMAAAVNAELHALADAYLAYTPVAVRAAGDPAGCSETMRAMLARQNGMCPAPAGEAETDVQADGGVIVGYLAGPEGRRAAVIVNCADPWRGDASVRVSLRASRATLWRAGQPGERTGENGRIAFSLASGEGVLVEL